MGRRAGHKGFAGWYKDCLVKQGCKSPDAENLVR